MNCRTPRKLRITSYQLAMGLLLVLTMLALACTNPFISFEKDKKTEARSAQAKLSAAAGETGTLLLQFGELRLGAQTVTPNPVDPSALTYAVLLTRDGFDALSLEGITETSATLTEVPAGVWNLTVTGFNGADPAFRSSPGLTVEVAQGDNPVTVSLHPLTEGQGDISISITWPAGLVQDYDPVQSTFAQYPGGTPEEITDHTVPVANGITYSRSGIASGYYRLAVYLRNAINEHVATVIQIIHVYDTLVSTKTIALTENEIAQPPSAPTGLVATQPNFFEVQLSWTDQSNVEEGFRVYRNGTEIGSLGAGVTSYTDPSFTGGESYTYEVRAYNSFGESAAGLAVVGPVTPLSDTGLEGPANGSIDQPLMLNFEWDPGFGANALDLYILQGGTPVVTQENIEPTAGGYTLNVAQQLQRDTNYDWYLVARNADFEVATPTESFTTRGPTLYVDSTNGINNIQYGTTLATPLLSIQYAIDEVALDDDLIEIAAGTYTEFVNVTKSVSLQGVGPATIIGAPAGGGTGDAAVTTGPGLDVKLMNLQVLIDTGNNTQFGIATSGAGGDLSLLDLLIVHRGTSLTNGYDAVTITNRDPLILSGNRIHILNPDDSNHAAVRISGAPDAIVTNNRINTVETSGVRVGIHLTSSPRAQVVNNVMYRPGGGAAPAALHPEVRLIQSPDVILAHNTFTRDDGRNDTTNGRGFVQLDNLSGNLLLVNNIFSVLGGVPNGSAIYFAGSAGPGSFQALEGNLFLNFTNLFQDDVTAHTSIPELNGWAYAAGNFDVFALSYVADTFESDTWLQPDTVARSLVAAGGSRNFIAEIPDDIVGVSRGDGSVPVSVGAHHIPGGELLGATGPSGGWIFYENPNYHTDGWRFMEAAPEDIGGGTPTTHAWSDPMTLDVGTDIVIGSGLENTNLILGALGAQVDRAAQVADAYQSNGFVDWFLASRDELNLMYQNLHATGLGGFGDVYYWSSSQATADTAHNQRFDDGNQGSQNKNLTQRVRPARRY